jgi:hypothetical protein
MRRSSLLLLPLAGLIGCVGAIRETTSPRTATEMLLVSTAAYRAVMSYDARPLEGRRVYLDVSHFESIDRGYVESAMRDLLSGAGALLVDEVEPTGGAAGADVIVEVRNGALGIYDGEFTLGLPSLPVTVPGLTTALVSPPLYIFRRDTAQGWAKFQIWAWDRRTRKYLSRSHELWGSTYYNQWYWFGIGPFDGSNDVYPQWDLEEAVWTKDQPEARAHEGEVEPPPDESEGDTRTPSHEERPQEQP